MTKNTDQVLPISISLNSPSIISDPKGSTTPLELFSRVLVGVFSISVSFSCWALTNSELKKVDPVYKVICADPHDCHPAVAGLISDKDKVCTSILIKENIMATNLHCLPQKLRRVGASCKKRIEFSFPETINFPEELAECDQVLAISSDLKDTPLTPDYAFLKLATKLKRPPVKINTEGVSNNEPLTIFKIDPHEDIGLLRKVTCMAAQGSILNPLFMTAQSSVISLVPCEIVLGNSGSPLFSTSNEIKGLINSKGLPADIPLAAGRFEVAFASNFSCLNIPALGFLGKHKNCKTSMDRVAIQNASGELVREAVHPLLTHFSQNVSEQFFKIHEQTRDFLKWETDQQDIPYTGDENKAIAKVVFKPKCIEASRDTLEKMEELLNINYSEWGVELHLDQAGRPTPQLAAQEVHQILSFSKKDLTKKSLPIKLNDSEFTVPFCSELATK